VDNPLQRVIEQHFASAVHRYPGLQLMPDSGKCIVRGVIDRPLKYNGVVMQDRFEVEIRFPDDYPESMPHTWETSGRIPDDFHPLHDGSFCLGEPLEVMRKFAEKPTLLGYIANLVCPYLFSFLYWEKHGVMPWGELSHGLDGILENYRGLFALPSDAAVLPLLEVLATGQLEGHQDCPCGSGRRLRKCHGALLKKLRTAHDGRLLQSVYLTCSRHVRERDERIGRALRQRR